MTAAESEAHLKATTLNLMGKKKNKDMGLIINASNTKYT